MRWARDRMFVPVSVPLHQTTRRLAAVRRPFRLNSSRKLGSRTSAGKAVPTGKLHLENINTGR